MRLGPKVIALVKQQHGPKVGARLEAVILANRGPGPPHIPRFPSEV